MANTVSNVSITSGKVNELDVMVQFQASIDTYSPGGVDILTLLGAESTFQGRKLKTSDIKDCILHTGTDAESIKHIAKYDRANGNIILVGQVTGASTDFEERSSVAAAVTVYGTAFLR